MADFWPFEMAADESPRLVILTHFFDRPMALRAYLLSATP